MMSIVDEKVQRGGEQRDAMGLMLAARDEEGRGLSPDEIVAAAVELFIAGSDTTGDDGDPQWALFLFDQHPPFMLDAVQAVVRSRRRSAAVSPRGPTCRA